MNRLLAAAMACAMTLSLAACSNSSGGNDSQPSDSAGATTLASCFQERLEANGGEIVMTDNYMNKDPDFSAQIDRYLADNKGAEALFFSSVPDDIGTIVKQFRDKGVTEVIVSGDGAAPPADGGGR